MFRVDETHHVVDIRSPAEFAAGHIPGATSIPLALLPEALCALPPRDTREPPCVTVYGGDADAVEAALRLPVVQEPSLADIFEADRLARIHTRERFLK